MTARFSLIVLASLVAAACTPARRADIQDENTALVGSASSPSPAPSSPPSTTPSTTTDEPGSRPLSPVALSSAAEPAREHVARSHSGKLEAFVRAERELWVRDEKGERLLVPAGELRVENKGANLPPANNEPIDDSLGFSPDDERVYFQRWGWATSRALFYVEVATGKVVFFHDANRYTVIAECADKAQIGRVITFEHSYFDIRPEGAVNLYFLVDSAVPRPGEPRTGQSGRVGPIGFDEDSVDRFIARVCRRGQAPPPPEPVTVPARLSGKRVKCPLLTLERDDLALLDGTRQVRFRSVVTKKGEVPMILDVAEAERMCDQR